MDNPMLWANSSLAQVNLWIMTWYMDHDLIDTSISII